MEKIPKKKMFLTSSKPSRETTPHESSPRELAGELPRVPTYDVVVMYAIKILGRRRLTEKELCEKIRKRYAARIGETTSAFTDVIARVLARMKELHYVDDRTYAEIFIRNTMQYRPHGSMWIRQKLLQKGVSEGDIASAMKCAEEENISCEKNGDLEFRGAMEVAAKKLSLLRRSSSGKNLDSSAKDFDSKIAAKKQYEKLFRFLAGRGFSTSVIFRVLREVVYF